MENTIPNVQLKGYQKDKYYLIALLGKHLYYDDKDYVIWAHSNYKNNKMHVINSLDYAPAIVKKGTWHFDVYLQNEAVPASNKTLLRTDVGFTQFIQEKCVAEKKYSMSFEVEE